MARVAIRNFGTSLYFNGTSAVVTCPNILTNFSTTDYSIGMWYKAPYQPSNVAGNAQFLYVSNSQTNPYVLTYLRNGQIAMRYADGTNDISAMGATSLQIPDQWIHIMTTSTGSDKKLRLYVNGVLVVTSAAATSFLDLLSPIFRLGASNGTNFLNGFIDTVTIHRRSLSSSEIQDMYFRDYYTPTNMILRWNFDEGSGTTANDASGNGNVGTITAATYSTDVASIPRTAMTGRTPVAGRTLVTGRVAV